MEGGESLQAATDEQVPNLETEGRRKMTTLSSATYSPEREPAQQGLA